MSTYKGPDGKWRYRCTVTLKDGTKERISGTPSEANTKLAAKEAEDAHRKRAVNPPEVVEKKEAAPGFADFAKAWLDAYPAAAENRSSTITEKEFHLRIHLVPYWKDTPIDKIDSMGVTTMIAELKKKKRLVTKRHAAVGVDRETRELDKCISPKTVRNVTQTLHKILTTAVEWGKLPKVPKFPKRKKTKSPWDFYTAEESERLLSSVEACGTGADIVRDHALLAFALKTGPRAGEQLAAAWTDVDWNNMKIHFRRQYHRGEFRELKAGPLRSVDMSPGLAAILKKHRSNQVRRLSHISGRGDGSRDDSRDLIFPVEPGSNKPMELWHLRVTLRRYARRAGLRRIKWHELRHSFASQLVSAGVSLKQVQEWLGHSTIDMTMRYAHLAPTTGASPINVLDRVAGS